MLVLEIIFFASVGCLIHTYFIYPLVLSFLSLFRKKESEKELLDEVYNGHITVIIAAHNEEDVIEKKIRSVIDSDYKGSFDIIVGSDSSTDGTNIILKRLKDEFPERLKVFLFNERHGKPSLLNILRDKAQPGVFILTDANVYFDRNTITHLVSHFNDPQIGIVGANIINLQTNKSGISIQEKLFIKREVKMKYYEGKLWGSMIGAFGGCYAIRSELLPVIPPGFAVEDFFITFSVLKKGRKAITDLNALVLEDVSNDWKIEYKRKVRISVGNFQNLKYFISVLWPPYKGVSFAFFSHKILRWLGPFFIILAFIANIFLAISNTFYIILLGFQLLLAATLIIDFLLKKINIHIVILRFVSHFFTMNFALLEGFIKYIKGENTNVWQPTKRNQ